MPATPSPPSPAALDRYDLYELCAQAPDRQLAFVRAVHAGAPRILGEDFCGSGALSRAWALQPGRVAVAVDHDDEPLRKLRGLPNIVTRKADVTEVADAADAIIALNYSVCELHDRGSLVAYLSHTRGRLNPGGVFIADLYGGPEAFIPGSYTYSVTGPAGERIRYTWQQVDVQPLTARVRNAMHFHVKPKRGSARTLENAFEYDWRLWSVPELTDALHEAGFEHVEIHDRLGGALDAEGNVYVTPVEDGTPTELNYVVYVVARADATGGQRPELGR